FATTVDVSTIWGAQKDSLPVCHAQGGWVARPEVLRRACQSAPGLTPAPAPRARPRPSPAAGWHALRYSEGRAKAPPASCPRQPREHVPVRRQPHRPQPRVPAWLQRVRPRALSHALRSTSGRATQPRVQVQRRAEDVADPKQAGPPPSEHPRPLVLARSPDRATQPPLVLARSPDS